jgi:hypothetical protein
MAPQEGTKIAFLFLTRSGLHAEDLWVDFFRGADPSHYAIYAHSKGPPPASSLLAGRRIAEIVDTEWGTISLVRATLALLRAALEDGANGRFVLLSESCVPLYDFARVRAELLADDRAWIAHSVTPPFMIHQKGPSREFLRWSAKLQPIVRAPSELLKQQQWMVFSRPLAQLFLAPEAEHTAKWDGGLFAPDEHYFVNVAVHELRRRGLAPADADAAACLDTIALNRKLTFVEWGMVGNGRAPLKLLAVSEDLIARARNKGCLFLRKVAPGVDVRLLRVSWEAR